MHVGWGTHTSRRLAGETPSSADETCRQGWGIGAARSLWRPPSPMVIEMRPNNASRGRRLWDYLRHGRKINPLWGLGIRTEIPGSLRQEGEWEGLMQLGCKDRFLLSGMLADFTLVRADTTTTAHGVVGKGGATAARALRSFMKRGQVYLA